MNEIEEFMDGVVEISGIVLFSILVIITLLLTPIWIIPYLVYKAVKQWQKK